MPRESHAIKRKGKERKQRFREQKEGFDTGFDMAKDCSVRDKLDGLWTSYLDKMQVTFEPTLDVSLHVVNGALNVQTAQSKSRVGGQVLLGR
jgi:hypothetical protein